MRVTRITVTYTETHSFGNHHNVRPSVTYEAEITPDSNVAAETSDMIKAAKVHVQVLVDEALEENGYSPIYTDDELYEVFTSEARREVVIISAIHQSWPPFDYMIVKKKMRLMAAINLAVRLSKEMSYKFSGQGCDIDDLKDLPLDRAEAEDIPQIDRDEIPF